MTVNDCILALSIAGHDKGRLYAVLKKDSKTVFLADGKLRKLSAPKKKNLKHVLFLPDSAISSVSGITREIRTDAELRRRLAEKGKGLMIADIISRSRHLNAEKDLGGTNIG
jgi:ribosomal protein L14E/L6E/L27E